MSAWRRRSLCCQFHETDCSGDTDRAAKGNERGIHDLVGGRRRSGGDARHPKIKLAEGLMLKDSEIRPVAEMRPGELIEGAPPTKEAIRSCGAENDTTETGV